MIIKKIFDNTFLSVPYQGGISSFSLFLMACAYLNNFDEEKEQSLSSNLSGFFHFFGAMFNPQTCYLNGSEFVQLEEESAARPFFDPFIVVDPLCSSNNIAHSTYRFHDIQRALQQAFSIINQSCQKY
mmetsp:Transcript_41362/g.63029  ORF Transcript_41362/g.63029 Transcript_41362/m.63029 type:complete len:128 (-) Transcript_41362:154-537(-)